MPAVPNRPVIIVDPGRAWGRPAIQGISTDAIAGMVMSGENVATVADEYGLTRHEVLLACWHEGLQGRYRREWSGWAFAAHLALVGRTPVDELPDPPDRRELTSG